MDLCCFTITPQTRPDHIQTRGFEELNHPAYSPNVAPSDFFPIYQIQKNFGGKNFFNDDELKETIDDWFASKTSEFFNADISALGGRHQQMVLTNCD